MSSTGEVSFLKLPHLAGLEKDKKVEYHQPIKGEVTEGLLPKWIKGSFYRNGPGLIHFAEQSVTHWFDGMALPRRFEFRDDGVYYHSRFVQSQSYKKNLEAGRIVVPEFGTHVQTKQDAGFLTRTAAKLSFPEFTDNCLVNIIRIGGHIFGISETNLVRELNPETLESMDRIDLGKYMPVNMMSSTPLIDDEGTVYNFTTSLFSMGRTKYNLISIPKPDPSMTSQQALKQSKCVCSIDSSWRLSPSYHHSFSMTAKYAIFIEQPLKMSIPKIGMAHWSNMSYSDCLEYRPELKTNFFIVDKEYGTLVSASYVTDPFIVYQNINAYEQDGHLVLDLCAFEQPVFFQKYLMENLNLDVKDYYEKFGKEENAVETRRFVLPLNVPKKCAADENLVTLPSTKCTAYKKKDLVVLTPEILTTGTDYPCINPKYIGKPYKYYYSSGGAVLPPGEKIVKIDVETKKETNVWQENGCWASRPAFVARPNGTSEDDGVVISPVWCEDGAPFLLILDGKTFEETRISFDANIPPDLHGLFVHSE